MRFDPSRVSVSGPLARHAVAFGDQLLLAGYPPERAVRHVQLLAQLSRWMESRGLGEAELCEERLSEFLQARRAAGYWGRPSVVWMTKLLGLVPGFEVTPARRSALTALELMMERYCRYLSQERGLAKTTIRGYVDTARLFLGRFEGADGGLELSRVTAEAVICFVVDQRRCHSVGSAANVVTALRSLLRFLSLEGRVASGLADAVPAVSVPKGFLPRALRAETVAALLDSCDSSSAVGKRDLAVLTLLKRLGLRAGEVSGLVLDDLDWRHGELLVTGKGGRREGLPLPVDAGEALAAYLAGGRPASDSRRVFLQVQAPFGPMTASNVTTIVRRACQRAGLAPVGAHRLRHSAATAMLHAGASLAEVGQILRQTTLSTTAVYAKVDRVALRALARPWPGAPA
ncbi:MAG: site-specific integrase [Mycobacteriales bacterium]